MNNEYASGGVATGSRGSSSPSYYLTPPVGLTFTPDTFDPPFTIYGNGTTSFNFDSLYNGISVTDYYVSPSGSDSNDGLTISTPKKGIDNTMTLAASAPTPWVRINLAAGDYMQNDHPGSGGVTGKNVIFKAAGNVRTGPFVKASTLTWTSVGSNTYSANRSSVAQVRDYSTLNAYGDPTRYYAAASLAECQSTMGSWFQSGSTLYVHKLNNTTPTGDTNLFIIVNASNTTFTSNYTWIFDGGTSGKIELIGGATGCLRCTGGGTSSRLYCRNTWFRFSTNGNNLHCYGIPYVLIQGGGGSGSYTDILNYHIESGRIVKAVEIGVTCKDAGIDINGTGSDNCSTIHDGCKIIRILGSYDSADGPVVADVNDGTESWNILCDARNSVKNDDSETDASWLVSTGAAKMWLDRCTFGGGSRYDVAAGTGSGAILYYRGMNPTQRVGDVRTYP